jgi:trk system potassium uptake protein TrkH
MTTLATGGYSTKDASIGFYNSVPIELVGIVFMVSGALPLIWYARLIMHGREALRHERQIPAFMTILGVTIALVTAWNVGANDMPFGAALRVSAFNVTSILTDTGYASADFSTWGSFAIGAFFVMYLIGGCAGSTAGAIKIFRWQILLAGVVRQLKSTFSPHRVVVPRYGDRAVDSDMVQAVRNFFFMYIVTLLVLSLSVMATGLDFLSSISAVAQAMANAGPGLGPVVGPAANFAGISDTAKWLLVAGMLIGRLELSTIYVLLLADYWRS